LSAHQIDNGLYAITSAPWKNNFATIRFTSSH
jgi:hypothetical protein